MVSTLQKKNMVFAGVAPYPSYFLRM